MVIGYKDDKFHNTPANDQAAALQIIRKRATSQADLYFALATFKQGWHKDHKDKNVLRVRSNVDQLKALWFDIDFKGGLSDPAQVVAALREFSNSTGMPPPSILVHSGNGIHAYWPFTTAVPYERWQRMADRFKELAHAHSLPADLGCTADSCRVLRPPGTRNWKDPSNPKPVTFLYDKGPLHDPDALEVALECHVPTIGDDLGPVPSFMVGGTAQGIQGQPDDAEFTGSHASSGQPVEALFSNITERCAVAKHWLDTRGEDCSEPEWTAALQLLKHCLDGELHVHEISKGHIDYTPDTTNEKYQQRLDNDAGPTLCKTLEGYRPDICAACPHRGKIKTPIVLGIEVTLTTPAGVTLSTWRAVQGGNGMERKMLNPDTNQYEWVKVLRRKYDEVATSRSIVSGYYDLSFKVMYQGADDIEINLPTGHLGNDNKLKETMANFGAPLQAHELQPFKVLMATWLEQLQGARAVASVTEQLGWVRDSEKKIEGFSAGTTTYLSDGTQKTGVRIKAEFAAIGKLYEPVGDVTKWMRVAKFLTEQNNPAFTTILASAFAAPLLHFTGIKGSILAVVSPESGVGKSSALQCAQAVWGCPSRGVNSVDDTKLSVARKLGFLNNLPAYWDELRGRETMEGFTTLAFQVSQGKEKTRLDSSATMREVNTWETMLIAASNESIFEYMGQTSQGSDAGVARTFEVKVEPFETDKSRAEVAMLFETLQHNYGGGGQVYAEYLATHAKQVEAAVKKSFTQLAAFGNMRAPERIWFATVAVLVVGAVIANKAGLVNINIKTLRDYLIQNIVNLRGRSRSSMTGTTPEELIAAYMQQHQDKGLITADFPKPGVRDYVAEIVSPPRSDRILYHLAKNSGVIRVSKSDFILWLKKSRDIQWDSVQKKFRKDLNAQSRRANLGGGTKWSISRQHIIDMDIQHE